MQSKLPQVGTSIFSVMSQLAVEHQAINLSQGFPNFAVDLRLRDCLSRWAQSDQHQYAPMSGYPPLLERLARLTKESYGRIVNPTTEVLITAGATEGIFATIQALVPSGAEVIILDPSYDCYETPIVLCQAKPVRIAMRSDFTPDWERIENTVTANTRMLIINNPHNPSGRIWQKSDFLELERLLNLHPQLLVLSDEVYEYITFEQAHISVHHFPNLWDRIITVSSFGKSFHITGWKVGYLIAAAPLLSEIKKVHQFLVFSVNTVAQAALNEYMDSVEIQQLGTFYQEKRDYFRHLMVGTRFDLLPCEGTYFQLVSYASISSENDLDFTRRLVTEFGVASVPLSPFYKDNIQNQCIRFCFAKDNQTLEQAVERLRRI
ncbi:methionine aminotransferase [Flavobacterium sp.]|uniref:methionine aminotransferase n=1 Tax=Flavobacterium sp. TaxID=239 RepID=UPI00261CD944|nr:methionine aminotransferase [Flavobacterium sp.]